MTADRATAERRERRPDAAPAEPPRALSLELAELQAQVGERRVTLGEVIRRLRGRGYLLMVAILALPFCQPIPLPGLSTPVGLAVCYVAGRLALGRRPWLPRRLQDKRLPAGFFRRVLRVAGGVIRVIERAWRPRLAWAAEPALMKQFHAAIMFLSAAVLLLPLPIPFSNTFPGWVILLVAVGLLARDGLALLLAHAVFIAGVGYFVFLGGAAKELLEAAGGGWRDWTWRAPAGWPAWFVAHALATAAMVGVIWVVQCRLYPGFARRPVETFASWHEHYRRRITWVVGPLMLVELATGMWWLWREPRDAAAWLGALLIAAAWACTALVQVPQHRRLGGGYDPAVQRRLVRGNWWRTAIWTARGVLLAWICGRAA